MTIEEIKKSVECCYNNECLHCHNNNELGSGEIVCIHRLLPKIESCLNETQLQIAELENKCERLNNERYEESLRLQQFYSRLGVEAYGEDIQEQAIKELDKLKEKESKKIKKLKKELEETNELLEMANEDRAFKGEMWEGFKDKCKILTTKLHTQPKEIVEKIKELLVSHCDFLDENNGWYIPEEKIKILCDKILKEYGESDDN